MANNTGGGAIDPNQLMSNPILASLIQSNPSLLAGMAGGGAPAAAGPLMGNDLVAALMGSAMDVTGTYGQTGHAYTGVLPPWAQGLSKQVLDSPDFNPYLGVVSQSGDERVFMGVEKKKVTTPAKTGAPPNKFASEFAPGSIETTPAETHLVKQDSTLTVTQAMNMPYTWDENEVAEAVQRLKAAGMQVDGFDGGSNSLVAAWGMLVNRAAMMYDLSGGKKKVTPWDVLDLYKSEAEASGALYTGTKTQTAKRVTDITEGQAWSSLQGTLSQMLGRDPSDQEVRDFTYRMNQMAAQNPAISKTITNWKNGKKVGATTQHVDPGFTSDDMAQEAYDQAQNAPDYAEFRGASYLFNAVMSALGPLGG